MFPFRGLLPKCLSDWDQSQDLRTQSSSPTQVAETQATRATTCCLLCLRTGSRNQEWSWESNPGFVGREHLSIFSYHQIRHWEMIKIALSETEEPFPPLIRACLLVLFCCWCTHASRQIRTSFSISDDKQLIAVGSVAWDSPGTGTGQRILWFLKRFGVSEPLVRIDPISGTRTSV